MTSKYDSLIDLCYWQKLRDHEVINGDVVCNLCEQRAIFFDDIIHKIGCCVGHTIRLEQHLIRLRNGDNNDE